MRVVGIDCAPVAQPSYSFTYEDYRQPKLAALRESEKLEEVIAGARTEFEEFTRLRAWVSRQWRSHTGYDYAPWDAFTILAWKRKRRKMTQAACIHFGVLYSQVCQAMGLQCRPVITCRQFDRRELDLGHFLTEVWSNDYQKWVLMDPDFDVHFEKDGLPLDLLELHDLWVAGQSDHVVQVAGPSNAGTAFPSNWCYDSYRLGMFRHWCIVLRNNHLTAQRPGPLEHGPCTYHWSGFLWWGGHAPEELVQFPFVSARKADMYWPLNRVRIFLAETAQVGTVQVQFGVHTPNFDMFEARVDKGSWMDSGTDFTWKLHAGRNSLQVRARNHFGRAGPASEAIVDYNR